MAIHFFNLFKLLHYHLPFLRLVLPVLLCKHLLAPAVFLVALAQQQLFARAIIEAHCVLRRLASGFDHANYDAPALAHHLNALPDQIGPAVLLPL